MPKLAANLSLMYPEIDFLDRFAAAAADGFKAVEYLFPYAYPADELAGRLRRHGLQQVLFNLPPGNWEAGERGFAAVPGREAEFAAALAKALDYAKALGCPRLHCMAGIVPPGADRTEQLVGPQVGARIVAGGRVENAGSRRLAA
jgi:hydroxypyruvate isomerase